MKLLLSDYLTPAEVSFAECALEEKLARIENDRLAEIAAINERFELLQRQAGREVLAAVLSVSMAPAEPEPTPEPEPTAEPIPELLAEEIAASEVKAKSACVEVASDGSYDATVNVVVCSPAPETPEPLPETPEPLPPVSEPMPEEEAPSVPPVGFTAREITDALGYHKDTLPYWKKAGLLPEPVPGTGGHPTNPARYVVDLETLRETLEARQEAAKTKNAERFSKPSTPAPAPALIFNVNEAGKWAAVDEGKAKYAQVKRFYLARRTEEVRYVWDCQPSTKCDKGWEVVEFWQKSGTGRWESSPIEPGAVGSGSRLSDSGPIVGALK